MKEIVVTGECGPTKNDFRNDDEEHDSSKQQYPQRQSTDWRKQSIDRLGIKQKKREQQQQTVIFQM